MGVPEAEVFESIIVDNLLNVAGSPKGVLLLQQSGTLDRSDCRALQCWLICTDVCGTCRSGFG